MGNSKLNGMVEQDEPDVLGDVNKCSELTHDEFFVFRVLSGPMRVCEEDHCFGCSKGNSPLSMHMDQLVQLGSNPA